MHNDAVSTSDDEDDDDGSCIICRGDDMIYGYIDLTHSQWTATSSVVLR